MKTPTQITALGSRKVHIAADDKALCGATSMYHMVPTTRPATCAKCKKLAGV